MHRDATIYKSDGRQANWCRFARAASGTGQAASELQHPLRGEERSPYSEIKAIKQDRRTAITYQH